jgi:hypothetical protein
MLRDPSLLSSRSPAISHITLFFKGTFLTRFSRFVSRGAK